MRKFTILFFASIVLGIGAVKAQYADVMDLNYPTGGYPWGSLAQSGSLLYGMNSNGGANGEGCIFSININGTGYTDLFDFNGLNGANPYGSLTVSGTNQLFGMTSSGGANGQGNVFTILTNGTGYHDLLDFNGANGAYPEGSLVLDNSGVLYGMTEDGGANHVGRVFSIDTNGSGYADVLDFNTANGANPTGSLTLSGSQLFGMTPYGGSNGNGCLFSINTNGSGYSNLLNFTGTNGANPQGGLVLSSGILYGMTSRGGNNHYGRIFSITTTGSGYTSLLDFNNTNGALPYGSLVLSPTGLLYGMTEDGGANGYGCMFSIQINGSGYSDMYDFNYSNGGNPEGSPMFSAGVLYGMTTYGGANDNGVIFDNNTCTLGVTIGSVNNILCFSNTGSATAVISGGVSPFTYSWTNGSTNATASGLSGGAYTVTVTDLNTCVATASVTITEPGAALAASTSILSQVSCGGYNNGNVQANVTGGISPYTYSWSNGSSTVSTSNPTGAILVTGGYTVTVTDLNGCTTTASVTLTQPVPIRDSIVNISNVGCNGGNAGSATIGVKGGKFPYTYQWAPNSNSTKFASSLSAGTYTVTVTDNNGCVSTLGITITQPAVLHDSLVSISYPPCNGNKGSITIGVTGGNTPYTYLWAPRVSSTATATNINAGTYTITIKDKFNCPISPLVINLTQPTALRDTIVPASKVNVTCNGNSNGSATVGVKYGTSPYTYSWSNGQTNATASGLSAGIYSVSVTDNNGCSSSATILTITQPNTIRDSVTTQINVRCIGNNSGYASIGVKGGTAPYTFLWSPIGKTTQGVSNLSAGAYTVTVSDNHGCNNPVIVTITQPNTLSVSASESPNISCNGGNNGGATEVVNGGTSPFTYSWSNGKTTSNITGLTAGSFTVTVHDNCGNSATASVTLTQPTILSATATANPNSGCSGSSSGSATANPSGGTAPYTYLWSDPSSQTTAAATGLSAGSYTVTINDNNGCNTTASVTITQAPALSETASINSNVTCNGGNNGSATANVIGGTSPYNYLWSDASSQTNATATGLVATSYTVTVTDANNCTATASVTITQPGVLAVTAGVNTNVSCNSGNNGSATANPSGGTLPYTYSWSNGNTTANATGLTAGSYTVTITDNCSASVTANVTITEPVVLTTTANINSNVTCNGGNTGNATANPGGGTSPYNYLWSDANSQTTATANGLIAGSYTVTVTDANNCSATASVTISQPSALSTTASVNSNVSCSGGNGGSATANPTGGTLPYTYSWSNGNTNVNVTGLIAGSYTITVTDNCSASVTASVSVTQPGTLSTTISINTNVRCHGGNTGSATANPSGGTLPYTYLWSDASSQITAIASGLTAGSYTVTVTDANLCTVTASVTITQPFAFSASASIVLNVSCNGGSNGKAIANVSHGTAPYTYSWSNGRTSGTIAGLSAGLYTVTVTDNCGASGTGSVTITQPNALTASTTVNSNVNCNGGGSATANPSGGTTPYTYLWSDASSQTNVTATGLSAGTYTVTVTDINLCSTTTSVSITQAPALTTSAGVNTNVSCNGGNDGSATANPSGGTSPYTYSWSNGNTNGNATGLSAGTYTVTVTDNCNTSATASITISQPADALTATANANSNVTCNGGSNGSASANPAGGTSPYNYLWSDASSQTNINATGLNAGSYTVTVTDANNCSATASVIITEPVILSTTANVNSNVSCNGGNGGSATANPSGGTIPYTYSWSDVSSQTNANATGLSAGSYTITVTDNCGASATASVTITEPIVLSTTANVNSNVTCNGGNNGSATANPSGGTSPYNYTWSDASSQTTAVAGGLIAGNYTVTVKDANNCSASASVVISQPIALSVTIPTSANVTCNGAKNGTATAVSTGGNTPYTYAWSNGLTGTSAYVSNSASASGMPGTYTYTVTVQDQCGATATATVLISNPAVISATFTKTQASSCGNVLGTAIANATGGTPPYISYSWSSGSTTSSAAGLAQGTYTVVITDNNGCTGSPTVNIIKAAPISITFTSVINVGCNGGNGGSAQAIIFGGNAPFTFNWSNGQTAQSATSLTAGTYTLTLTDNYNCSATAAITITQPLSIRDSLASIAYPACNGNKGSATIGVKGGTSPYTYVWGIGNTTATVTGLAAATYTVTVRDNHGCSSILVFTVTQPGALRDSISSSSCVSNQITATVGTKGGTNPYSYAWSPGGGSQATVSGLSVGTYTIVITDSHNCSNTIKPSLACVPSVLSPERDTNIGKIKCCEELGNINLYPNPSTGLLTVAGLKAGMVVEMYDYTGRKVTSITASDISIQFNITDQPNGVYLVRVLSDNGNLVNEKKVVKTQ